MASTLSKSLNQAAGKPKPGMLETSPANERAAKNGGGTFLVGAHFDPSVRRVLKLIEADTGKRMKALLGEAINDLAAKYGKPEPYVDK